jgi:hypothetical protein
MSRLSALSRTPARPRFRIVRPDGDAVILPFPSRDSLAHSAPRADRQLADGCVSLAEYRLPQGREVVLNRARALHRNRCCPNCHRGGVMPLDLGDGDVRHGAMPVPGSSTLVGFCCNACGAEWPA